MPLYILGIVVHICNPQTRETEIWGHLWLHSEFKVSLGCSSKTLSQDTITRTGISPIPPPFPLRTHIVQQ